MSVTEHAISPSRHASLRLLELTWAHGRLRSSSSESTCRRQQERPHGALREVSERNAWTRLAALAGRARAARLRECVRSGVEAVGRTAEDDSQRVPSDALAERGA